MLASRCRSTGDAGRTLFFLIHIHTNLDEVWLKGRTRSGTQDQLRLESREMHLASGIFHYRNCLGLSRSQRHEVASLVDARLNRWWVRAHDDVSSAWPTSTGGDELFPLYDRIPCWWPFEAYMWKQGCQWLPRDVTASYYDMCALGGMLVRWLFKHWISNRMAPRHRSNSCIGCQSVQRH